jgi:membrane associated rhomboid family serine protease
MFPPSGMDFKRTPVTLSILAVIVALEVVSTLDPPRREYLYDNLKLGMLSLIWAGELWRPLTSSLLHANFVHAAFNVYWLAVFGGALERRFGPPRFLALIVLLSYVSAMPEFVFDNYNQPIDQQIGGVGFSGVGYGLFGMLWIGRRWRAEFRDVCDDGTVRLFIGWFFLCILLTHLEMMPVANIAHGTGWLFGALYGLAAFARHHRRRWIVLAAVASALVLSTLIGVPGHRGYEAIRYRRQLQRQLEQSRQPQAVEQREDGRHPGQ